MITYFSYGSNMNPRSLLAKGVKPDAGINAVLRGWQLRFDVQHWFPHEGGVANIHPMNVGTVHGVLYKVTAADLERLDQIESLGVGYQRVMIDLETEQGVCSASAYVGMADFLNPNCLPSRRYLNLLVEGAHLAGLGGEYIHWLQNHPTQSDSQLPPYQPPAGDWPDYPEDILIRESYWTALCGHLFSMESCRWQHQCLLQILAGRDTTLFHLRRLDSSRGDETLPELQRKGLDQQQWHYLNSYLHAYGKEYLYRGRIKQEQSLSGFWPDSA
jgi:sulfite reductase (NADPH) flavoprotein alpha-component